jgi:ATP-dependent DNA helicase RecQ
MLVRLSKMKIAEYIPQKQSPMLILLEERLDSNNIRISAENYLWAKNRFTERMEGMLSYSENNMDCRSVQLLAYFGEKNAPRCAQCDVCRHRNEAGITKYEFDTIVEKIKSILAQSPDTVENVANQTDNPEKTILVMRWMMDNGMLSEKNHTLVLNLH